MKAILEFYRRIPRSKKTYIKKLKKKFSISDISDCEGAILFGTEALGRKTLLRFRKAGIRISALSDNDKNKWGKAIDGIPVIPPHDIRKHPNVPVIITSKYVKDIDKQLRDESVRHVVPHYILNVIFPRLFPDVFYSYAFKTILNGRAKAIRAYGMLSDRKSKNLFLALMDFMISLEAQKVPSIEGDQYFPKELPLLDDFETYIDVGAFDGDTLKEFLHRQGRRFRKYIALEPDKASFSKLSGKIPGRYKKKISALCLAASSKNGFITFTCLGREDSFISTGGKDKVRTVTIDKLCHGEKVTSIKIDVEGHETDVLRGSAGILKRWKPKLAVCVYHLPKHLWEIPIQIARINPEYRRYYLRHHEPERYGTVLYIK